MANYSNPKRVHIVTGLITLILGVLLVKLGWDELNKISNTSLNGLLQMPFLKKWRGGITLILGFFIFLAGVFLTATSVQCEQYFITKKWGTCQ